MSSNIFENPQLITYQGTGNLTAALDSTGVSNVALTEGFWEIYADVPYVLQINTASGAGFGAKPTVWPAYHIRPFVVQGGRTLYLAIKALSATGIYYANKTHPGEI